MSTKPNIFELIANGKHEELELALEEYDYDLEAKDDGKTALMYAAIYDELVCLKLLPSYGAKLGTRSEYGNTALILAVREDNADCLRVLLEHGADPEEKEDENGVSSLSVKWGRTALGVAAGDGSINCLKILLDYKADIEAKDREGRTPLYWATICGYTECVKLLLEQGAKVEPRLRKKYPQYAELWPKKDLTLTDLSTAVEDLQQRLALLENKMQ